MSMTISFPHGAAVDATLDGHTVRTDQPPPLGRDEAMSPFDLFFASVGTCMGFYALRFCQERQIPTESLRIVLDRVHDMERKRVSTVRIALELPGEFPEKYVEAIRRAVDHCAVKRLLADPPAFEMSVIFAPVAATR